jgi:HK97 family phage portal protein
MIVRTPNGGSRELRTGPIFGQRIPTPAEYGSWLTATGEAVTVDRAAGLPAVFNAISLISETIASLPMRVYRGQGADKRTQERTWQWRLLHDMPNDEQSPFEFWEDVGASIETHGNAYIHKVKITRGAVDAMFVIDPAIVTVQRNRRTNEKEFHVRGVQNPDRRENQTSVDLVLTAADVLHVRGRTLKGGDVGLSPLRLAKENLAGGIARQSYVNNFFRNDASPPGALRIPDKINRESAAQLMAIWNSYHQGTHQAGSAGLLTAGAEWVKFGVPLEDAQFVESETFAVKDVARWFRLPPSAIGAEQQGNMEQETTRLLSFGMGPRLKRIESAFRADPDFFGSGELYPEFFADDFIRVDAATKAEVRHKDVQSGVLLPDEARADKGLPPLPDGAGKVPQITPVGGAPNPNAAPAATEATQ